MKNKIQILSLSVFIGMLASISVYSQKYVCKEGQTSIFSETPLENISALNKKVVSIIDPSTNSIAVKMQMIDFVFTNKLMQEHFNENYIESEKFPTSVFSGKINEEIDYTKNGQYPVNALGSMVIHGVKKEVSLKGTLTVGENQINLKAEYLIKPEDFNIDIPSLVVTKIAEEISVKSEFTFAKLSK